MSDSSIPDLFSEDPGNPHAHVDDFAPASNDGVLQGCAMIVLPENVSRADAVYILSKNIPVNQYGLPEYFIRSDLLHSLTSLTQEDVDAASIGLFYNEGYPALEEGTAFWNQLPHEPMAAHILFQKYLSQAEETGIRQLDVLAAVEGADLDEIRAHYREFYWSSRARAYDLFIVAAEERKRQIRTRKMETTHFDQAKLLFDKLLERFMGDNSDWIDELNAKEAIEVMEMLVKIQRLSVGLTGQHASSLPQQRLPEGASTEAILQHITRGSNLSSGQSDAFRGRLQDLLNGDDGVVLQAAILRIASPQHTSDAGANI